MVRTFLHLERKENVYLDCVAVLETESAHERVADVDHVVGSEPLVERRARRPSVPGLHRHDEVKRGSGTLAQNFDHLDELERASSVSGEIAKCLFQLGSKMLTSEGGSRRRLLTASHAKAGEGWHWDLSTLRR